MEQGSPGRYGSPVYAFPAPAGQNVRKTARFSATRARAPVLTCARTDQRRKHHKRLSQSAKKFLAPETEEALRGSEIYGCRAPRKPV